MADHQKAAEVAAPAATTAAADEPVGPVHTKGAAPLHISHGKEVALADYLVPGKTTVFDFYSEYCPPCRELSPLLEKLHRTRDDVVVVKIDINRAEIKGIDWQSPVAQEFKLESIPHLKVYNPDGSLKVEGDDARELVQGWIDALAKS
jgi:thiol-disulfide isomerase/thioredoxin